MTVAARIFRITPADAGKTAHADGFANSVWDHPRGCGENHLYRYRHNLKAGSPPRMRGKLFSKSCDFHNIRITPADAGKTHRKGMSGATFEDHPRGCGENFKNRLKPY